MRRRNPCMPGQNVRRLNQDHEQQPRKPRRHIRGLPLPVWISVRNWPTPSTASASRFQS
jgi:hypothetical protein